MFVIADKAFAINYWSLGVIKKQSFILDIGQTFLKKQLENIIKIIFGLAQIYQLEKSSSEA